MKSQFTKFHYNNAKKLVIVAPLDWGLGHATRCIPIIKNLIFLDFEVIVACDSRAKELLKNEFPELKFVLLKGYEVALANTATQTMWKLFFQIPKILIAIKQEKSWLINFLKENRVHCVISDNRYGLANPSVCSVFITHQLQLKTPLPKLLEKWLNRWQRSYINRFSYCWIPDVSQANGLAGKLSHPNKLPAIPTRYIGTMSRITKYESSTTDAILCLVSGPEPQRSLLEKALLDQATYLSSKIILVRGLPEEIVMPESPKGVKVFNHLNAASLQELIHQADVVICRSGYSTLMDLLPLGKKTVLIPTPGQTEQEYLAHYAQKNGWAIVCKQKQILQLPKLLQQAKALIVPDLSWLKNHSLLEQALQDIAEFKIKLPV